MKPTKLDVQPGGEWLVPAAKRWLEQAKLAMGRVGSKVVMADSATVTLAWGPALDYIRISAPSVWVAGAMFSGTSSLAHEPFKRFGETSTPLEEPAGAASTVAHWISSDGARCAGGYFGVDNLPVPVHWEDSLPVELVMSPLLGTSLPSSAAVAYPANAYMSSLFARATPTVDIMLGSVRGPSGLWPRLFLWSRSGGYVDLGFMSNFKSTLSVYATTDYSNWVIPVAISSDGARVFGNHQLQHYYFGWAGDSVGAYWQADTGWVRIPPPAGYVAKVDGLAETSTNMVDVMSASADGNTAACIMHDVYPGTGTYPLIWTAAGGSQLIDAPELSGFGQVADINISPSGEFVLIIPNTAGKQAVLWSSTGGGVVVPLAEAIAVDDTGRVIGVVDDAGNVAGSFYDGEITAYATPPGAARSAILAASTSGIVGTSDASGILWPRQNTYKLVDPVSPFDSARLYAVSGTRMRVLDYA